MPIDKKSHIMLDLELAGHPTNNNPAIIQLGAVHFDIKTGEILSEFSRYINLQSNLSSGMITDDDTLQWLEKNIPQTLQASIDSHLTLPAALSEFNTWVRQCHINIQDILDYRHGPYKYNRLDTETAIWSFGSTEDGRWINTAYENCNIARPWTRHSYMCARTSNEITLSETGRDYRREADQRFAESRKKHDAIEDCKHQIGWLIKGRNALRNFLRAQTSSDTKS